MLVYKTKLSAALWNRFSPVPVEVRYHFQKALFKLSLGYSFNPMSIFPLNFKSEDKLELLLPNWVTKFLKKFSFFSLILLFNITEIPNMKFLRIKGLIFSLGPELLTPVMAKNPGMYFPINLRWRILAIYVAPEIYAIWSS